MRITMVLVLVAIAARIALDTWRDIKAKVRAHRDEEDHDER